VNLRALIKQGESDIARYRSTLTPAQQVQFDIEVTFQRDMMLDGHAVSAEGAHHVNAPAGYLIFMNGTTCSHCGKTIPQ